MKILLLPFRIIWWLVSLIFNLTGRLLGVAIGVVLMIIGLILTATVLGAVIGIPLLIVGVLLVIRALFK